MDDLPDLTPDCSACTALCCVGLAFDAGDRFAIDKAAGVPCPHLDRHDCSIHDRLDARGFSGCVAYGCAGAGQRVTALYGGQSWQDDGALLAPMLETFAHMRRLHDLLQLLVAAARLPLPPAEETERRALIARLCPDDMTRDLAARLATGPLPREVQTFLRRLGPWASART